MFRFDRENATFKSELSKSCSNLEFEDSSSEGEEGFCYDDVAGNRLSLRGPDNSVNFGSISNIKSKWEDEKTHAVPLTRREELARQRKEELQLIRARQCQVDTLSYILHHTKPAFFH